MLSASRKIKMAIIALIFLSLLAILFGVLSFKPDKHVLMILNRTDSSIVVIGVDVDGQNLDATHKALYPIAPDEPRNKTGKYLSYRFESYGSATLTLQLKSDGREHYRLSCTLIDQKRVGCIYYVSIFENERINCICDSNLDFMYD